MEPPQLEPQEIAAAARELAPAAADVILAWAERRLGSRAAIASSFGPEDIVLLDLARQHAPSLRVFTIDTGRLPPETHEVMEAVRLRLGIELEILAPQAPAVEALVTRGGLFSFRESLAARHDCCGVRKVEPLRRALAGRAGWVTGLRREQSVTREGVAVVELDGAHGGIVKVNPLASWNLRDVWGHIRRRGLPYSALHDRGYASVGCAPCTRAVRPGEDERAGRWWWESPEHRECGLHAGGAR